MKQCVYCRNGVCIIMNNTPVWQPEKCRCPYYSSEIITCGKCGSPIVNGPIYDSISGNFYCSNCIGRVE